uniref:Maturation protein n=1 Tax=Beihai levi-like virus 27 TaxID=1922413 RepID=A0A1L3KI39_9VIRU|nr:hypothetical protein [Beihai levi-like virus 27]
MTNVVYQQDSSSQKLGGRPFSSTSTSRVGENGKYPGPSNYTASRLTMLAYQTATKWNCRTHKSYVESVGALPMSASIEYKGNHYLVPLDGSPRMWGDYGSVINSALTKAYSSQSQLSVELAEVFETAGMLYSVVKESLRFIVNFKKSLTSKRHRRRFIKSITGKDADDVLSAYMAFRFGIRPLVYSTQDVLDILNEGIKKPLLFHGKASGSNVVVSGGYTAQESFRAKVSYQVTDPELFARSELGLSTSELAATAWELIPLSWAVDYFLPIGEYIQWFGRNLRYPGCTFVGGYTSFKTKTKYNSYEYAVKKYCWDRYTGKVISRRKYSHTYYDRKRLLSEPTLQIRPFADFSTKLNRFQLLDLVGVVRGLTK